MSFQQVLHQNQQSHFQPIQKHQQLIVFDLDLRGGAVFSKIKNLTDVQKNGGFELLGESLTNNQGNYSFTFYDWQYARRAERKMADVVVYAIEKNEIIGLSRLVNTEDYSVKGLIMDLEVILTKKDNRTAYPGWRGFAIRAKTQLKAILDFRRK